MNLWQDFLTSRERSIVKWSHYFPIYEKHLTPWRNKTLTFMEIGVAKGGSVQMWKRFFGPMATIVGIDINPHCKEYEEDGIHVRIGDQSDPGFLAGVTKEFGQFDIILDDGSHKMEHIRKTFDYLYPTLSKNGIYIIEDLHTAYWEEYGGGWEKEDSFINVSKKFIDELNAEHSRGAVEQTFMTRNTLGISFYDSVIVFERGAFPVKKMVAGGVADEPGTFRQIANRIKNAFS
jgi:hypothetical protein